MQGIRALSFTRNAVRVVSVTAMFIAVTVATADGFAQSYSGLYDWGLDHKLTGWKADSFPLLVDLFIIVGELGLFLLALDGHKVRKSFTSWLDMILPGFVVIGGWTASLWFNVNHTSDATTEDKITFAVPPIAAFIGLLILLRTVHRYMAKLETAPAVAPEAVPTVTLEQAPVRAGTLARIAPAELDPTRYTLATPVVIDTLPGTVPVRIWPVRDPMPVRTTEPVVSVPAPTAPVPVRAAESAPAALVPTPVSAQINGTRFDGGCDVCGKAAHHVHEKWDEGVRIYAESISPITGKGLSQRVLAEKLGMRNRTLAAAIAAHYIADQKEN